MLYLLQQMFIDLNLMEKFHIEVINLCNKTFVPLVIVNHSFEFKGQKVNGNLKSYLSGKFPSTSSSQTGCQVSLRSHRTRNHLNRTKIWTCNQSEFFVNIARILNGLM